MNQLRHLLSGIMIMLRLCSSAQHDTIATRGNALEAPTTPAVVMEEIAGMIGLKGKIQLEGNGYVIVLAKHNWQPSHAAYEKAIRKEAPRASLIARDVPDLPAPNMICERLMPDSSGTERFYFIPSGTEAYWLFGFATGAREVHFEHSVVRQVLDSGAFLFPIVDQSAYEIVFCGRRIELGPACHWMSPHNCQCSGLGQMNWSVTSSAQRAQETLRWQLSRTIAERKELTIDTVDVVFEEIPTTAIRVAYKVPAVVRTVGMTGRSIIAYYVHAHIRGRDVYSVLSHYDDEAPEGELPPLLAEVMQLR